MAEVINIPQIGETGNNMAENIVKSVRIQDINNVVNTNNQPNLQKQPVRSILRNNTTSLPQQNFISQYQQIPQQVMQQMAIQDFMQNPDQFVRQPPIPDQSVNDVNVCDYYSVFGFQLSKTTVYIIIAFILCIAAYYIYSKWYSGSTGEKKKKKRPQEVSYQQQEESKNKDKDKEKNKEKEEDDD
jgi:hypothetical protein